MVVVNRQSKIQNSKSNLPRGPAAVDEQILAGDVTAGVADQHQQRAFQFMRQSHAFHRAFRLQPFDHRRWSFL